MADSTGYGWPSPDCHKPSISTYMSVAQVEIMVTAGANQAFTNVAVALLDASDKAVLFSPYYFNHLMAVQVRSATFVS